MPTRGQLHDHKSRRYTSAEGRGKNPYFGAVVGRLSESCSVLYSVEFPKSFLKTAPRVANRIAEGKFKLDGKEYQLAKVLTTFFVNFIIGIGIIGIFTIRMT